MKSLRFLPLVLAGLVALAAADASAQSLRDRSGGEGNLETERPQRPPLLDRATQLDRLFEALKLSPDVRAAQMVEARIEAVMLQSGSPTADLLMSRARTMIDGKEHDLSLQLLDSVIEFAPDFTEAYAQRATVHYLQRNYDLSLADIRVVIAREPRHFSAFAGLGVILQDIGRDELALDAFRRAIAIHPHLRGISDFIKRLELKVEGREI